MGLVGSIGKAAGAVAKFCDDYNVVVRSRSSPPTCIHLRANLKPTLKTPSCLDASPRVPTQDVMHYALIPGIIIIGMYTTPRPTLAQLLTPV